MSTATTATLPRARHGVSLIQRLAIVIAILFAEKSVLNLLVDFDAADQATGFGFLVRAAQHYGIRFAVSVGIALVLFAWLREDPRRAAIDAEVRRDPPRLALLALHVLLLIGLAPLCYYLYGRPSPLPFALTASLLILLALGALLSLLAAAAPLAVWRRAAQALGVLWLYAIAIGTAAVGTYQWSQDLWAPTARATFSVVYRVLHPFVPDLTANPATLVLATPRFAIEVSDICSGLEGVGLMLGFCAVWLLWMRRQFVFPRAFILIPIAIVLILTLNVLRISALVLIGAAGYPEVAIYGFHSVAGWIAFNSAAVAIALISRRSRWLARELPAAPAASAGIGTEAAGENPTAAYLLPLLAILATGLLTRALSSGFETLYGLRLLVAALALFYYRDTLRRLDWRCGWRGMAAGLAVAALWFPAAAWLVPHADMPLALRTFSPDGRGLWILLRTLGSVLVVPIAEELAFRGYLMRRLETEDFDQLPFARVGLRALLISAVVFGLGHGALWLPGIAAGLIYGAVVIRTGRLGEAVLAHATTNALLSIAVIATGQWQLW